MVAAAEGSQDIGRQAGGFTTSENRRQLAVQLHWRRLAEHGDVVDMVELEAIRREVVGRSREDGALGGGIGPAGWLFVGEASGAVVGGRFVLVAAWLFGWSAGTTFGRGHGPHDTPAGLKLVLKSATSQKVD